MGGTAVGASRAIGLCAVALLASLSAPHPAAAQATVPGRGHGSVVLAWQNVVVHDHVASDGERIDAGDINAESLYLALDYGFTERLALTVSIPYIHKQYRGPRPHDPDNILPDEDGHHVHADALDDGRYHGHWQDWGVDLRWQWRTDPVLLAPFISLNVPSHDYTYFAHAAPGTRQKRIEAGLHFARRFTGDWDRGYLVGSYGYSWYERVLDMRLRASRLTVETGYHVTDRFSLRALATWQKGHNGLDFPDDFPLPRNTVLWFNHDRIQRVDYLDGGLGFAYDLGARVRLFGTWLTNIHGEGGHRVHNAVSLGLTTDF